MYIKKEVIFAAISGLLLTVAFSGNIFSFLGWIALVPLFAGLRNLSPGGAFRIGMIAGMVHYLTLLYWVVFTMRVYGLLPWWLCFFFLALLAAYLSLYPGFFSFFLVRYCRRPIRLVILAPLFWVGLEYIRTFLLTGFPWSLLGYSQFHRINLVQIADLAGVYGIAFLVVLVNAGICLLLLNAAEKTWQGVWVGRWQARSAGVLALGLVLAAVFYGQHRITAISSVMADAPMVRVSFVQGNIDQATKWDPAFQIRTTRKYVEMTQSLASDPPDLVVWPETAMPFYFEEGQGLASMVTSMAREMGVYLVLGSPRAVGDVPEKEAYYNSAYLVTPEGRVAADHYDKFHLVPFGEYVPLKSVLFFVGKMVSHVGDFSSGQKGHTLKWKPDAPDLGVQICFESIFPGLSRLLVKNGAGLLVNLTNDAWFGKTSAAGQHFTMAAFRAIENRRSLVRCANTGISGIVDPVGRVTRQTGLFQDAVMVERVPLLGETTLYTRFGDWLPRICLIVMGILLVAGWRRRRAGSAPTTRYTSSVNRMKI
ncbi:apolipoprotein N-acyltransferase [Desulfosarcina sp. OttesenSCG-928-G17]|nr:apolipoprotein N-acyltransferase [Desulfosarcina sp. OttesenSCG-928-G17]